MHLGKYLECKCQSHGGYQTRDGFAVEQCDRTMDGGTKFPAQREGCRGGSNF